MAARSTPPNPNAAALPGNFALFLLDPNGSITGWTHAAAAVGGYPPEELRGMPLDRLFAASTARGGTAAALRKAHRKDRFSAGGWSTPKDGRRTQATANIEPLHAGKDMIEGFAVTIADLAANRPSATALADSEQKFRILVQGVTDYAIYMIDPQGYITNWNL